MPTHSRPRLRTVTASLGAGLLLALTAPAFAQDPAPPAFTYEKPPEKPEGWKAQAKGGLLLTGGNSQSTSGSFGVEAARKAGDNKVSFSGQVAYGHSRLLVPLLDGNGDITGYGRRSETTTNSWQTRGRYDRFLTENNSIYGLAQIGADRIAGKKLFGGGQVGYSRQLFKNAQHTAVAELGYDFSHESYLGQPGKTIDPVDIHSMRLFVGELFAITKQTGLNGSVEALFNLNEEKALDARDRTGAANRVKAFKDTRVVGKLGLTTTLWKDLSFGFGFTFKYDENPAPRPIPASAGGAKYSPGFQAFADKVDTITEATLVFTFL